MNKEETIRELYLSGVDEEIISAQTGWPISSVRRITRMIGLTQAQKDRIEAERQLKIKRRRDIEERLIQKCNVDPIEELAGE